MVPLFDHLYGIARGFLGGEENLSFTSVMKAKTITGNLCIHFLNMKFFFYLFQIKCPDLQICQNLACFIFAVSKKYASEHPVFFFSVSFQSNIDAFTLGNKTLTNKRNE